MLSFSKKFIRDIGVRYSLVKSALKNKPYPMAVYPVESHSGVKVHLGAGGINLQGWINVDARMDTHIHLLSNDFELEQFSDHVIDEIYMCHVLEHFSFKEAEELLLRLKKKLRSGGLIRISVPCIDRLIEIYIASNRNLDKIKYALMGGQDYQYNYHKSVYNEKVLCTLLERCGFSDVVSWDTAVDFGLDIGDWSTGVLNTGAGAIPVSLNLKAICHHG